MEPDLPTLILVPAAAVGAVLVANAVAPVLKIPLVVFEILLGLLIGPALLGWVRIEPFTSGLADFGLVTLFFLAGNEIDFAKIKGRPLRRAGVGWLISITAGVLIALVFASDATAAVYIGVALASTALGTIMPVLRDAGELETPFGRAVIAVGAVGEFGPLLAISLFLSGREPGSAMGFLLAFAVVAGAGIWLAERRGHRTHGLITATLHSSGQFAVRLVVLLMASLTALSIWLGIDMLLGAFAAGVVFRVLLANADHDMAHQIESKLEAVGFGFLVPIFFINTGITYDLKALIDDAQALLLLPVFLLLLLVVRGLPGALAAPAGSSAPDRRATVLFSATALPIIVAVTAIGVENGELESATAASLVGAGMLSVLLFPLLALSQRRQSLEAAGRAPTITSPAGGEPG